MANKLIRTAAGLKNKQILSVKEQNGAIYFKLGEGDHAVIKNNHFVKELAFEDMVELGLVTKSDLDAFKRLKKLGIATEAVKDTAE